MISRFAVLIMIGETSPLTMGKNPTKCGSAWPRSSVIRKCERLESSSNLMGSCMRSSMGKASVGDRVMVGGFVSTASLVVKVNEQESLLSHFNDSLSSKLRMRGVSSSTRYCWLALKQLAFFKISPQLVIG